MHVMLLEYYAIVYKFELMYFEPLLNLEQRPRIKYVKIKNFEKLDSLRIAMNTRCAHRIARRSSRNLEDVFGSRYVTEPLWDVAIHDSEACYEFLFKTSFLFNLCPNCFVFQFDCFYYYCINTH